MQGSGSPIRVVIADDQPLVRLWLATMLDECGHFEVAGQAGNAAEAVAVARATRPDLVLLDVVMPGGGGQTAARAIRRELPGTTVVAVSASDDVAAVRGMLASGATSYVVKGTPPGEVVESLLTTMGRRAAAPARGRAASAEPAAAPPRVLVVEEDPDLLTALATVLEESGLELVGLAQTPFHAVSLAAQHTPDVAVIDVGMPAGGGARVATDVAAASVGTRIVAFSSHSGEGDILRMIGAGATSFLVKNGSLDHLVQAVLAAPQGISHLDPYATAVVVAELRKRLVGAQETQPHQERRARIDELLERGAVRIALQPIQRLSEPEAIGYEALARFPDLPRRTPDVWFAEAASVGRGLELELLAVRRALERLPDLPRAAFLSINVSPDTAVAPELHDLLEGAPGGRLVLEITEHAPVMDYDLLASRLKASRRAGMRLAVDDCGAGFASLRHVLLLAPDFIKLDIAVCRDLSDPMRRALTRALAGFAAETGSQVIAEGVETPSDLEALREVGVDFGQGFHFARPSEQVPAVAA